MSQPKTLFDKIWENHLVTKTAENQYLIYIDRHLVHEVTSPQAFEGLRIANRSVRRPDLTLGVADYNVPTTLRESGIDSIKDKIAKLQVETLEKNLLDNKIIYTSACACKMIYDAVREARPVTTRQIAVTGDAFSINAMYNVRIGTPFTELVKDLGDYVEEREDYNCHIGSFLSGEQIDDDSFVLTASTETINVNSPTEDPEDICIKCGECNDICPAGILPQNIMDAELRNVNARIIDLHTDECVECGLCSYVCPSKINVLEWVRRAKRRVG